MFMDILLDMLKYCNIVKLFFRIFEILLLLWI